MSAPQIVTGSGGAKAASYPSAAAADATAPASPVITDSNAPVFHDGRKMASTESYNKRVLISRLDDTLEPSQWPNREALEEVKRRAGIKHKLLDQWIYKFLENKHFDINETVAKLERRLVMERNELCTYTVDDIMRACMKAGVCRILGEDRTGRTALYFVTSRDFPKSSERKMRTANFDMWLSYACRMRARDARCGITMLINQKDASFWSNTDMSFQSNIALRIAKFYPNVVDKAYVCNMGGALSAVARPILSAFPKAISDHIFVYSEAEVKAGKMLEFFEKDVLPVEMGGTNETNLPDHFRLFSDTVEAYYLKMKKAVAEGRSLKEWEMEQALEECARIEEMEKKAFTKQQQKEEHASAVAAASKNEGGFVSAASYRNRRNLVAGRSAGKQQPATPSLSGSPGSPNEPKGAEFALAGDAAANANYDAELESCASDDFFLHEETSFNEDDFLEVDCDYEDDGSELDDNERERRVQSRRLRAIQVRRLLRDEAFFRNTLVDLYWYQIKAIRNYYFGQGPDGDEATDEEMTSPASGRLLLGLPSSLRGGGAAGGGGGGGNLGGAATLKSGRYVSTLATNCPRSFQGLTVGFVIVLGSIIAVFFFLATLFLIMGVSAVLVMMFINIFSSSGNVFPMGLGMLVVAHQGILVASRGFELASVSMKGIMLPPLRWLVEQECFGSGWGLLIQFIVFFTIVLAQIVSFAVAALEDPLVGLQQLFAVGLYSCLIIMLISHVFFPFGVGADPLTDPDSVESRRRAAGMARSLSSSVRSSGGGGASEHDQLNGDARDTHQRSRMALSIYFFFDITENLEDETRNTGALGSDGEHLTDVAGRLPTSSLVLTLIPTVMSIVFGIAFAIERSTVFLVLAIVTTLGAGFTLTHFIAGRLKTLTANLSRSTIWIGTLVWSFTYWSIGLVDEARWSSAWMAAIAGLLVAYTVLAFLTSSSQQADEATAKHQLVFRLAYVLLAIATLAGIVTLFITNWILGVFSILFLAHGVGCFTRRQSHSSAAMLFHALVVLGVLIVEILFADNIPRHFDVSELNFVSRSAVISGSGARGDPHKYQYTPFSLRSNQTTPFSHRYESSSQQNNYVSEQYALCQRTWRIPGNINMRIPDFAYFCKLSYSKGLNATLVTSLLPQWELMKSAVPVGANGIILYDAYRDRANNNTIVTVRGKIDSFFALIKTVSLWSEAISLLPFVSVLPASWTASVVQGVSNVAFLFDPTARNVVDELQAAVAAMLNETANAAAPGAAVPELILVGHSVGGSIAAAAASRMRLRAITFSSPGLLYSQSKFDIDPTLYDQYVLNIRTRNDAVGVIDSAGRNQQLLDCEKGVAECSSIDFPLCDLTLRCDVGSENVTVVACENF